MKKSVQQFMKGLKECPVYVDMFSNASDVFVQFAVPADDNIQICFAEYNDPDGYSGYAMVIYYDVKQKKYFEVYGSHCSCYGLEDQWTPEELKFEALELRFKEGIFYTAGELLKRMYDAYMNE